jgi:hypothetical protein
MQGFFDAAAHTVLDHQTRERAIGVHADVEVVYRSAEGVQLFWLAFRLVGHRPNAIANVIE